MATSGTKTWTLYVDEVIDDGLPAAVLVLHRAGDGGGSTVLGI